MKNQKELKVKSPGDYIGAGVLYMMFVIVALVIAFVIDSLVFQSRTYLNLAYPDACEYQVPKGWKIVSNGEMYAVKKDTPEGLYLWEGRRGTTEMYITISAPSLFYSECKAKAYLRRYLEDNFKPKMIFNE